jgi:glycosyltransferase involved in cell wall biosynthesis
VRLAIVPVSFPLGNNEPYLAGEGSSLAKLCESVMLVPVRPHSASRTMHSGMHVIAEPLLSRCVWLAAARGFGLNPRAALRSAYQAVVASGSFAHGCKNLLVLPKAFATAAWLREHRIDHVHAYWLSTPATVAYVAASIAGIEWSSSAHRWDVYEANMRARKIGSARFIRTISDRGSRDLGAGRSHPNVHCVPLGVPMAVYRPPGILERATLRLLCPAALVAVKGHETLIEALRIARERGIPVECTFAGDGPLRAKLERRVRRAGLSAAIVFAGYVPQARLHAALLGGAFDGVVLASRDDGPRAMEGVPSALIEAMAIGIPAIATTSGSVPELLDARTGYLAPPGDAAALATAFARIWRYPHEARARRERAAIVVRAKHNADRQGRALSALIYDCTGSEEYSA